MFLAIEGGEGAGKSTLAKGLGERIKGALITREPGGTLLAEAIRQLLLDRATKIGAQAETLLFLAARSEHIDEVIAPALDAGHTVICDRYNFSTIAYQAYGRGLNPDWVAEVCDLATEETQPDITLLLDLDPSIGLARAGPDPDRFEGETLRFHQRVRDGFLTLHSQYPDTTHILDAAQPPEKLLHQALAIIDAA